MRHFTSGNVFQALEEYKNQSNLPCLRNTILEKPPARTKQSQIIKDTQAKFDSNSDSESTNGIVEWGWLGRRSCC